jgi:N-methylhydantoinase B
VRMDNPSGATLLNISGRDKFTATGLFGGMAGGGTEILLRQREKSKWVKLHPRKIVQISRGDHLLFRLPGGGGYGKPSKRDPSLVYADVESGLVSRRAAKLLYSQTKGEKRCMRRRFSEKIKK